MTKVITRWVSVLSIVCACVLSIPAVAPPVPSDPGVEPATDVDLFDYVRAERSQAFDPHG